MKKFLEQVQVEMERQQAAAKASPPSYEDSAYCPRCGASNPPGNPTCVGCDSQLRKKSQKGKKGQAEATARVPLPRGKGATGGDGVTRVVSTPVPTSAALEVTPPRSPTFSLNSQNLRQGLIYKILLGPPRGLQEDFD